MRLMPFTFLVFLAGCQGCGKNKPKDPEPQPPANVVEELKAKYDGWEKDLAESADKNTGWLSLTDCDGTLWMGEAVASGHPGQLVLAEYEPGQVHRRPKASGECWPGESGASTSNDMHTGYILGMYATKDLDALQRLATYGEAHDWVMGEPKDSPRVLLSPAGMGLLGRAVAKLGGDSKDYGQIPEPCLPVLQDFEFHLETLSTLVDGDIVGSISDVCLQALKSNAAQFPEDALLQTAAAVYTGAFDKAISLLLDDSYLCPAYVRPVPVYCTIHKAFAASIVLKHVGAQ